MTTICGIEMKMFSKGPTPKELGTIVAHMPSDEQAEFFAALGEGLRNCCGGREFMQWQAIANSIRDLERNLLDGSASRLIDEINQRLVQS